MTTRARHNPARAVEHAAWALARQAEFLAAPLRRRKLLSAESAEQLVSILRALADTRAAQSEALTELARGLRPELLDTRTRRDIIRAILDAGGDEEVEHEIARWKAGSPPLTRNALGRFTGEDERRHDAAEGSERP